MIRLLLVFSCFILVQDEPVISWSESYKLSWSDFKDKPDNHTSAVAITASGITFGFSIRQADSDVVSFSAQVQTHFYPEKSWYKPNIADDHVLAHEQFHFNITELYARKFRKRIENLKVSNTIRKELKQMHNTINNELAKMQDRYDEETNYSRNYEAQKRWETYIANELEKLSKYKSI